MTVSRRQGSRRLAPGAGARHYFSLRRPRIAILGRICAVLQWKRKNFFFEKKKQKTFVYFAWDNGI
jgi:hypothetical protein